MRCVAFIFIAVVAALGACVPRATPSPPSSTAVTTATVPTAPVPTAAPTAPPTMTTQAETATSCRVTVTETEGCAPEDVEKLVEPARPRISKCRGATGGKISIRIRHADGRLTFLVEPGASLNPMEQQCVLDALVIVTEPDVVSGYKGGISVPPSGFTSLLTIEF